VNDIKKVLAGFNMHFKYMKAIILLIGILLLVFITPTSMAANYEKTNTFQAQYGILNQKLYVSVPPSLYDYYGNMSHTVNGDSDYANFVTPQAVEPIAEGIQNITRNMPYSNEQFADAVLALVHQMSYVVNGAQYPVETLVNNSGDCVDLSLLAASIMQAGGLDVVLIHYIGITPGHMNVGVYLPDKPVYHTAGEAPTDFVYNNKTYWTAEATPAENWKVGDQWSSLSNVEPVIIPLENTEQSSPAQVSSSLNAPLLPSSITINLSQKQSSIGENTRALNISGSISPAYLGGNVSIYVSSGTSYDYFTTVTDDTGGYMLTWNFTSAGTYYIRASCGGPSNYAGADSETLTVFAGPQSLVQFETLGYNYIFGQASPVNYQVRPLEGVDDFLSIPLMTNVSLSYDFIVLQAGQTVSNVQTATVTIPGNVWTVSRGRNMPSQTMQLPDETVTVPVNVPTNLQPLMLPSNFNQTINNQFSFILQNNAGNYSLNVNALNDYEISNVTQGKGCIAFLNATEDINQNTWYNFSASVSDYGVTANIYNTNGTLIESLQNPNNSKNSNETMMLIANNVNNAVVFKDLTIQALNNPIQPLKSDEKTIDEIGKLFPFVSLSILLVATLSVTLVYVGKKRQMRQKKKQK
jgi:hypothetical protein